MTERLIIAGEGRVIGELRDSPRMIKNIRAGDCAGGGEKYKRAVSGEHLPELIEGSMGP